MSILIKNTKYKDISPIMTGKSSPSPYAVSCSVTTINDFWKALDGNDNTYFRSNISTKTPFTLKIDFGNTKKVAGYILDCSYSMQYTMNSWTFEGSNNNTTWEILDTQDNITWTENPKQQFVFFNTIAYRYYRFNVSKKNGTNSVTINTIQFLEEEDTKLEFRKVKKDNLPSQKSDGVDTLYFTENGSMYITNKDGELIQCGGDSSAALSISSENRNAAQSKEDGLYVKDLSDEISKIRIAQHTINSELEHCEMRLKDDYTPVLNEYLPFKIVSGNMTSGTENLVKLKSGKTYIITICVGYAGASTSASISYVLINVTTNEIIQTFQPFGENTQFEYPYTISFEYTPDSDCEIGWKTSIIWQNDTILKGFTICTIHEIGRAITVDPVEYVNAESGIEDTPVGEIITRLGNTPPKHYLLCNGKEYNIADYPDLAQHFIDEFGTSNYFGGDGETTFAVPDLMDKTIVYRQLQMTSDTEPQPLEASASSVHTINFPAYKLFDNNQMTEWHDAYTLSDGNEWVQINFNTPTKVSAFRILPRISADYPEQSPKNIRLLGSNDGTDFDTLCEYTDLTFSSKTYKEFILDNVYAYKIYRLFMYGGSRDKTNPNVYCFSQLEFGVFKSITAIKYEPTYFMKNTYNADNMYSTDEMIVGKWIDGKPLYRKTIDCGALPNATTKLIAHNIENIGEIVKISGTATNPSADLTMVLPHSSTTAGSQVMAACTSTSIQISSSINLTAYSKSYVTIEYTKTTG